MSQTAPRTRFSKRISYRVWNYWATRGARELYGLYGKQHPFVTLHSYPFHDGDPLGAMKRGISASVDFYVCPYNHKPAPEQKRVGQQIVDHAIRNWNRLKLDKIIWNGQYTRDGRRWWRYKHQSYKNWGTANYWTKVHANHPHIRFER